MEHRNQHQRWPSTSSHPKTEQRSPDLSSSSNLQPIYSPRTQTFPTNNFASIDESLPHQDFNAYASSSADQQQAMNQQPSMYPANRPYYGMTQSNPQPDIGNTEFPPTFYHPNGSPFLGGNTHGSQSSSPPLVRFQGAGSSAAASQGTSNGAYTNLRPNLAPNVAGRRPGAGVRPPGDIRPTLPPSPESSSLGKRPNIQDDEEDGEEEENKGKPAGACMRCKTLKVKCEFRGDSDPCRRCLNGGHDCMIPGRKKRRTPPKREHLLNQIREQAEQINVLMADLEKAQSRSTPSAASSPAYHLGAPDYSPTLGVFSHTSSTNEGASGDQQRAVEDWLSKAKESLAQFGGLIGIQQFDEHQNEELDDEWDHVDGYLSNEDTELDPGKIERLSRQPSREFRSCSPSRGAAGAMPADIPTEASAWGLLGRLSLAIHGGENEPGKDGQDANVGVANDNFFRMRPLADALSVYSPDGDISHSSGNNILTLGIVTPSQAEKLFTVFFDHMNASLSLLDPVLYTAQKTYWRSPFLFTVVCAVASRFDHEHPNLYAPVMHHAQMEAGSALTTGRKSIEMCAAFILLALYPVSSRRWDESRTWLYLGVALRLATDLNLQVPSNVKPTSEAHARELLSRTRIWLNCFNLDRSTGSLHGKLPIIPNTDYIACHSEGWWYSSPYNMKHFDIHTCAYNHELRVMSSFFQNIYSNPNHPKGVNRNINLEQIAMEVDDELRNLKDRWFQRIEVSEDPQNVFRTSLLSLAYSYARLVALSHGFQYSFGKYGTDENPFLKRCLRAASDVVESYTTKVAIPAHYTYILHGPEAQSTFVTFASAFLIKLLQPKFTPYVTREERKKIRSLVLTAISRLKLPEINIDDRSASKLYARFLEGLLQTPMAHVESNTPSPMGMATANALPNMSMRPDPNMTYYPGSSSPQFRTSYGTGTGYFGAGNGYPMSSPSQSPDARSTTFSHGSPEIQLSSGQNSLNGYGGYHPNTNNSPPQQDLFNDMPFFSENEMILQSMQQMNSMSDANVWQEITALPGLGWMSNFTGNLNQSANMNEDMTFQPTHFQAQPKYA